jgi:hypothetical protein
MNIQRIPAYLINDAVHAANLLPVLVDMDIVQLLPDGTQVQKCTQIPDGFFSFA